VALQSLHDNLLVSYSVDCEGRTIKLRARRPDWPNRYDRDRLVVFTGVEAYNFENDAFGNIILALEPISVDELLSRFGSAIRESYRLSGAPGPWAGALGSASEVLVAKQAQGFLLSSSYGLSGWVLAREALVERDTPLRSEVIRCVLPLIHDWRAAGLDVQALVGDVISADSRLNFWFANLKREEGRKFGDEEWLAMLDALEATETRCKDAVQQFVQGGDRKELVEALKEVVAELNQRPDLQ
jgi:hypothetical protein